MPAGEGSPGEPVYSVVAPVGAQRAERVDVAPGLAGIDGHRIGFLWDSLFKGDLVYDAIAGELGARFADVRFVGHEAFGDIHGSEEQQVLAELPARLREHEVDAVVAGIGA